MARPMEQRKGQTEREEKRDEFRSGDYAEGGSAY
jgi:hypothetical protein